MGFGNFLGLIENQLYFVAAGADRNFGQSLNMEAESGQNCRDFLPRFFSKSRSNCRSFSES